MYLDVLGYVGTERYLTRCIEMFWDKFGLIDVLQNVSRCFGINLV